MKDNRLITSLTAILLVGFLATSLIGYFVSKTAIHDSITQSELPLTTDNIYSEVQKDLIRLVNVAANMAGNTFLRDWIIDGERNKALAIRYLEDVKTKNKAYTSFLVADSTLTYYYSNGDIIKLDRHDPKDAWYFYVQGIPRPYELNLDINKNQSLSNQLTVYVNYRIFDENGKYIGLTGLGITVDYLHKLIADYRLRYQRTIYFLDEKGNVVLSDGKDKVHGTPLRTVIQKQYPDTLLDKSAINAYEYDKDGKHYLMNVRYIPELKWYLVVEKDEAYSQANISNTRALLMNIFLSTIVIALVLLLTHAAIKRYQSQIEKLATTDRITGLHNRAAFDVVVPTILHDSIRYQKPLSAVLFDLDYFKQVNDQYGHAAGDLALKEVASALQSRIRKSDFFCRWGGEEFLVLLKDSDAANAVRAAESYRQLIQSIDIQYGPHQIKLTGSFGVATMQKSESLDNLISRADAMLYQAKSKGRNQVAAAKG